MKNLVKVKSASRVSSEKIVLSVATSTAIETGQSSADIEASL
ncbi:MULTISPECIES: hypothetical protein [Brenneria]|nr:MULTISPECIES: hypothetical protein [Brenneria]